MSSLSCVRLLCIAIFIVMSVGQANGQWYRKVGTKKVAFYTTTVDPSGRGNFTRIQSAIDAVPSNNNYWVCIRIKAGVYWEKIIIPYDKPYIILKGEGRKKTHVVWDDHDTVAQSPTFTSMADNIVVKSMSFTNAYNRPPNKNPRLPAAAAMIIGDQAKFCRCGFFGVQDTLWDFQGRHYYELCTIQGAVDFIFGAGQSIFERCSISVLGGALEPGFLGFVTAQGRTSPNDANGFVFKDCHVFGSGSAFWEGHGEAMQGFSSTTLISLTSLCLRVGMPGILLAKSEFSRASPSANLIWTVGLHGPHCTKHAPIDICRGRLLWIGIQYFQASELGKETKQGIREAIDQLEFHRQRRMARKPAVLDLIRLWHLPVLSDNVIKY